MELLLWFSGGFVVKCVWATGAHFVIWRLLVVFVAWCAFSPSQDYTHYCFYLLRPKRLWRVLPKRGFTNQWNNGPKNNREGRTSLSWSPDGHKIRAAFGSLNNALNPLRKRPYETTLIFGLFRMNYVKWLFFQKASLGGYSSHHSRSGFCLFVIACLAYKPWKKFARREARWRWWAFWVSLLMKLWLCCVRYLWRSLLVTALFSKKHNWRLRKLTRSRNIR